MTPDDLSRAVARLIEPEPRKGASNSAWIWEFGDYAPQPLDFASDRNLLPMILAEVERRGIEERFLRALMTETPGFHGLLDRAPSGEVLIFDKIITVWPLLNATPEQHCRAFLKACGGES